MLQAARHCQLWRPSGSRPYRQSRCLIADVKQTLSFKNGMHLLPVNLCPDPAQTAPVYAHFDIGFSRPNSPCWLIPRQIEPEPKQVVSRMFLPCPSLGFHRPASCYRCFGHPASAIVASMVLGSRSARDGGKQSCLCPRRLCQYALVRSARHCSSAGESVSCRPTGTLESRG